MHRKEAVEKSYIIPGWTWPSELVWLYDNIQRSKLHVEVGSFCGRSLFASTAGMAPGSKVWSVDMIQDRGACARLPSDSWCLAVFQITLSALQRANPGTEYVVLNEGSLAAARYLHLGNGAGFLDSVFIDAGHEYENASADIQEWMPLIKKGGLICGHDYSTGFPGVMDAVNEFVPGFSVAPETRIWYRHL